MTHRADIEHLKANFADERQALRAGDHGALAKLAEDRRLLIGRLSREGMGADEMRKLQQEARRNIALAGAAAAGVKDALHRLRKLKEASGPIGSYGATGQAERIGAVGPSVVRKA